ncbi:hypothetical protein G7B40_011920 [Aetokthonos hydrillicola Thurmond2011]|jgi:hypothetical protein|uniref:Uncharacterized protein n=1 Tax=Aetokthonos hydrillicola Thurmond2011 TaxID=2712845 RepID=A0AAP5I7N6_9CYAN|nr:hypothetical protein [Aetokthonos hydrillicola]MBO3459101.1 hypothetical protein [Aetokthonos hydrillicola CCALA 1050]MBW4584725.1 hypothetical protein [Aetokthonos hydrillicola CCALA 1050]MDR9895269.1 hypothetical protein [Aetokthonos hydrillicola Thurmond2011]
MQRTVKDEQHPDKADRYNKTSIAEEKSTMSITLDLPPKIEALLRQRAESTGQDILQMAIAPQNQKAIANSAIRRCVRRSH